MDKLNWRIDILSIGVYRWIHDTQIDESLHKYLINDINLLVKRQNHAEETKLDPSNVN